MVRIKASTIFPVTPETGFDYVTDAANWPDFWPDLVEIPDPGRSWHEPGDTMRLRMRLAGREVDLHMTLEEFSRPTLVRYHTVQHGLPETAHERHFEAVPGGFRYRLVVCYAPRSGLAGLFDRTLLRYGARRALHRTLDNLAGRLRA